VAGNPGRILRLRCKEEWIERLEQLKWWELPANVIRENFELFHAVLSVDVIKNMEEIYAKYKNIDHNLEK